MLPIEMGMSPSCVFVTQVKDEGRMKCDEVSLVKCEASIAFVTE